jgi:hypothetical protein
MHFLNLGHSVETVGRLLRALTGRYPDMSTLDESYRRMISQIRPIPAPSEGTSITFEDGAWGEYLQANNVFQDIFVGIGASDTAMRVAWTDIVNAAVEYVSNLNPELGRIIGLLVTDVVVLDSERTGGGSASHIPGLVCLSPGASWEMVDWAESLVHEAIHLNLFIEDMVYGLYTLPTSTLADDHYRVLSAVKIGERRPLDKAFHSAVVTVPLMWMQRERGESTLVDLFSTSLLECTDGLLEQRETFTDYGKMLVDELREFAESLDFGYVEQSISGVEYAHYKPVAA